MTFDEWWVTILPRIKPEMVESVHTLCFMAWGAATNGCERRYEDPSSEYTASSHCIYCRTQTRHRIYESGHERDSSGDWKLCLECGSWQSGMGGKPLPPDPDRLKWFAQ